MTRVRSSVRCLTPIALVAVVLTAGACDRSPLAPGPAAPAALDSRTSANQVPLRITAAVAVSPAAPPSGCLAYFTSAIEGTATHLGRFSGTGSTCITNQVAPDPNPPFVPGGPAPYATAQFTNPRWTLVAANGDELWLETPEAVGVFSLANNAFAAEGRQVVVGGTGRFAGATGELEIAAVNDGSQSADDFSGSGWIRFQ